MKYYPNYQRVFQDLSRMSFTGRIQSIPEASGCLYTYGMDHYATKSSLGALGPIPVSLRIKMETLNPYTAHEISDLGFGVQDPGMTTK